MTRKDWELIASTFKGKALSIVPVTTYTIKGTATLVSDTMIKVDLSSGPCFVSLSQIVSVSADR